MSATAPEEGPEFGILPNEVSELNKTIADFDMAQGVYLNSCRNYFTRPTDDSEQQMTTNAVSVISSFKTVVETILVSEKDDDTRMNYVATLVIGEDVKRIKEFEEITKAKNFEHIDEDRERISEELKELYSENLGDEENFVSEVVNILATGLMSDMYLFAAQAPRTSAEASAGNRATAMRSVGKHALDVVKIGAGVALGIWAMRRRYSD